MATVLSGISPQRRTDGDITITEYDPMGDGDRNAAVEAVAASFRNEPVTILFDEPVTILQYGNTALGASIIDVAEGRLFPRDGYVAFLPKGARTRAFRLKTENVLAVARGFRQGDLLATLAIRRFDDALATVRSGINSPA